MEDVVGSVFDLMGRTADPILEEEVINDRVDIIFEVHYICYIPQLCQTNLQDDQRTVFDGGKTLFQTFNF